MIRPTLLLLAAALTAGSAAADDRGSELKTLIPWLLKDGEAFKGLPFSEVIAAATGHRVLAFDRQDPADQRILASIGQAMNGVLRELNAPASETKAVGRINEASSHFENAMRTALAAVPEFDCDFPKTAAGKVQRSGYPDLRLVDRPTGRVIYLDPKLYAAGNRDSSLRTFYFEPKSETNKVLDDARHLIVGIEHDKASAGAWKFLRWELVDLAHFRVRLKAEFQASNRDLYREEAIVGTGTP